MPNNLTLKQQIEKYVKDPDLRHLLTHNSDLVPLLNSITDTYSSLNRELRSVKQTLDKRTGEFEKSHQKLTVKNQEISHRANHDSLTGLPNREYLLERLDTSILQFQRINSPFALLFIDIDDFKSVNDHFGHNCGDILLQKIALRLKTVIRETDTIARLAGDEFCVLLMDVESPADSARIARSLISKFDTPFEIDEYEFQVTMSIGISHYPEDGQDTSSLLKNADIAMYEAKQRGPNHIQFYEKRLTEQVSQRIEFEKDLYQAIDKQELQLQFQPVLESGSGNLSGSRVCVSWQHPVRGLILQKQLFDVTTDRRLYLPILEWVVEQCCLQLESWENKQLPCLKVSIPIEQGQFFHKKLIECMTSLLKRFPEAKSFIELTVNENIIVVNQDLALSQFKKLNKLGWQFAISNCGTGLLPIIFLQKSNINSIHIDSLLIQKVDSSDSTARLVKGIINMASYLQIHTHAPGIKNLTQLRVLEEMNCGSISGSHFGEPMDENQFRIVLNRFKSKDTVLNVQDNLLLG